MTDREMMLSPVKWPRWPMLPVKRPAVHGIDCAFLLATKDNYVANETFTLYHGYIYGQPDIKTLKTTVYSSIDELLADKWVVD